LSGSGLQPEPELELGGDPTPEAGDAQALKLLHESFARAQQQLEQRKFATAVAQVEALPSRLRRSAGPGWDVYEGYLHYKADEHEEAATLFEDVLRAHDDFARTHPSVYYFLARAHDAQHHFDKAVRNMRAYVLQASARPGASTAETAPPQ
jgi:tetratricopeptide (TPR) repeat protein